MGRKAIFRIGVDKALKGSLKGWRFERRKTFRTSPQPSGGEQGPGVALQKSPSRKSEPSFGHVPKAARKDCGNCIGSHEPESINNYENEQTEGWKKEDVFQLDVEGFALFVFVYTSVLWTPVATKARFCSVAACRLAHAPALAKRPPS